jgi:hypothetical protein
MKVCFISVGNNQDEENEDMKETAKKKRSETFGKV